MASSVASTSRLTPLTRADSTSSESPHTTTYSSRMASLSRSSSMSSTSSASALSRRGSMSAAASQEPVIRNGFVIPRITLTPPDDKAEKSPALPWQDYTSKSRLYVPVKTEDIGWEEGGLWWHGRFEYREVSLYGGKDDHVVGKYRGGPEGYGYTEIWDQRGFDYQPPRKNHEPAPQKSSPSKSSSTKRTSSARGSIDATANDSSKRPQAADAPVESSPSTSCRSSRRNSDASSSVISSTSSSRRTSDSTHSVDTAGTTPCDSPILSHKFSALPECQQADMVESPVEGATPFDKLEQALLALKAEKLTDGAADEVKDDTSEYVGQVGKAGGDKVRLQPGKSMTLSLDGPSASHHWPKGRGVAKIATPRPTNNSPSLFASSPLNPSASAGSPAVSRSSPTSKARRTSVPMAFEDEEGLGYSC